MLRTRDFLLFLIIITFLVVGIGYEFIHSFSIVPPTNQIDPFVSYNMLLTSYPAETTRQVDSQVERLEALRAALATDTSVFVAPPPAIVSTTTTVTMTTTTLTVATTTNLITQEIMLCKNYRPTFIPWIADQIMSEEREGMRVFYSTSTATASEIVASTSDLVIPNKVIHATLPIKTLPLARPNCISGDVVGIALDGSLIHNNEQNLYGIFNGTILIGYALDGFPIYGKSLEPTDRCGGTVVHGSYRYYLSTKRNGILGCYSGIPTKL